MIYCYYCQLIAFPPVYCPNCTELVCTNCMGDQECYSCLNFDDRLDFGDIGDIAVGDFVKVEDTSGSLNGDNKGIFKVLSKRP